jgi:hypothetical protein
MKLLDAGPLLRGYIVEQRDVHEIDIESAADFVVDDMLGRRTAPIDFAVELETFGSDDVPPHVDRPFFIGRRLLVIIRVVVALGFPIALLAAPPTIGAEEHA